MGRKRTSKSKPTKKPEPSPKLAKQIREQNETTLQKYISEFDLENAESSFQLSSAIFQYERYTSTSYKIITRYGLDQSLLGQAKHLLTKWRKSLPLDCYVSAPDYDDEYEDNNEEYKWTKLFKAKVIGVKDKVGDVIYLGDSSLENKIAYTLQEDESALLVHYVGFPEWQKQWFMSYDDRVVPEGSQMDCVHVLEGLDQEVTEVKEDDRYKSWICSECRENEYNSNPDIPLLICEGKCNRAFHYPCANLKKLPAADKRWICSDCRLNRHACHICSMYEKDEDLVYCSLTDCGLFYHASCLMTEYGIEGRRCPAHDCWCCNDGSEFGTGAGRLYKCMECPNAYHLRCIPPKAKFHELALLCHKHSHLKLPDLDPSTSLQSKVENKVIEMEQKIKKRKLTSKFFLRSPNDWKHKVYALPLNFLQEVYSKPPPYKHISVNRYGTSKPARIPPSDSTHCNCGTTSCFENCLNRLLYVECIGPKCQNKEYQNCDHNEDCGNRRLRFHQVAKCRPKREPSKGWGLKSLQTIYKGDLVQEYVGEVIHKDEMLARLNAWSMDHPYNQDYYIMQMTGDWYIDARYMGNLSRFMNHSCEPNCHLVPINVAGYIRIAIIALKDIEEGEYLTYNYRLESSDLPGKFTCRCGAPNCTGTFTSKKKLVDTTAQPKNFRVQYEKDVKFLEKVNCPSRFKRLNSTGLTVPDGEEIVGNGPYLKYKVHARKHRIFLWRSVVVGGRFDDRLEGFERMNKYFKMPQKKDVDVIEVILKCN